MGPYRQALARARRWLDGLKVDPFELRGQGIKGKKKLVELLDSYVRLHDIASSAKEKAELMKRMRKVVAITYEPCYHDMLEIEDKPFKQDATSYLRAAYLMEQIGLDTRLYRESIRKVHGRLNGHMGRRGPHQRMAFHWYYEHFGLSEPFPLAAGYKMGVISSRKDPYSFKRNLQVYDLTHEVFIPYRFGEKLDADFFSEEDKLYLRRTLNRLAVHYIMRDNSDMVSELVSCLRYLKITDLPVYREALGYLLDVQKPEGKWGSYERYRKKYGDFVDQGFYLHTTAVAIDALSVAFHFPQER